MHYILIVSYSIFILYTVLCVFCNRFCLLVPIFASAFEKGSGQKKSHVGPMLDEKGLRPRQFDNDYGTMGTSTWVLSQ